MRAGLNTLEPRRDHMTEHCPAGQAQSLPWTDYDIEETLKLKNLELLNFIISSFIFSLIHYLEA